MSNSLQSFIALMVGTVILATIAGLDAFHFHIFGVIFDELIIGGVAAATGVHWGVAGKLPLGEQK